MEQLQELFWEKHDLNDKLFEIENKIKIVESRGRKPLKIITKYIALIAQLRSIDTEINRIEKSIQV